MPKTWAVVFPRQNTVAFQQVEVPEVGPDDVLVKSTWSWISNGTEGSFLRGERCDGETPATAERPAPFPIIAGYQRVGEVVECGANGDFKPGELVFVTISKVSGLASGAGGHFLCAPADRRQVRRLPQDGPPPEAYAGLVLTQVGYNCGNRPALSEGDAGVVIGDGMVGQWAAQTLRYRGARTMLLGRHDARLQLDGIRACDRVVNTKLEDVDAALAAWAPEGIQVIVDTVGSVPTIEALFPRLKRDGQLVSAGYNHDAGLIDIQLLRKREATLHTPSGWAEPRMVATLQGIHDGWLQTLPLVTDRLPANQAPEAWRRIREARERTLGVLLDWREVE